MSRIRANQITNKTADGATTATNGFNVTGVCTATSLNIGTGATITSAGAGFYAGIVTASNFVKRDGSSMSPLVISRSDNTVFVQGSNGQSLGSDGGGNNDNTFFGNNAGYNATGSSSYNTYIGFRAAQGTATGSYNTFLGFYAGIDVNNASNNTYVGCYAAGNNTFYGGSNNTCLGYQALPSSQTVGNEITLGNANVENFRIPGIGVSFSAGGGVVTGIMSASSFKLLDGSAVGGVVSDAQSNTIAGTDAGRDLTSNSNSNSYFGAVAGEKNDTGDNNCGFGRYSAYSIRGGSKNTMLGSESGVACQSGDGNVCIGFQAGYDVTGSNNTLIGHMAAGKSTSSTTDLTSGSNNIFIGYDVKSSTTTVSNEIALGNENINHFRVPGIGVSFTSTTATLTGLDLSGLLREGVKITAGKLSDNTNIDLENGMVHYFTTQETTTSTPNLRFSSSVTLNNSMDVGETIAVTIITTAAAAGYSAQLTIDGNAVTENWIGGSAPSDGGSSGVDIYTYNIIKTASATFTVIANQTKTS